MRASGARRIHQNAPHHLRGESEELRPVLPFDAVVLNRRQRGDLEINVDIGTETVLYYGGGHWRYTSGEQTGQLGRVLCLAPLEHFTAEPPPFSEPGPLSRFSALAEQGHARDARQAI